MATTRGRVVFVALTLFIIYFLFIASPMSQSEKEYRQRTEDGLARRRSKLQGDLSDQEWTRQTNEKLRAILESHPHGPRGSGSGGVGSSYDSIATGEEEDGEPGVAGSSRRYRHTNQNQHSDHAKPRYPKAEEENVGEDEDAPSKDAVGSRDRSQKAMGGTSNSKSKEKQGGDPGKDMARERLQEYLKKPVVIFSKSYCPHSKRAKELLTKIYNITPAPLIVELDQLTDAIPAQDKVGSDDDDSASTTLGAKIQDLLGEITGRRTVPNIMIGMHSIGGNDLIWAMHEAGDLASTISRLGGKRVSVELSEQHDH